MNNMDIQSLKKALYEGVVLFDFIKKDGTHRDARGTTCPDLIPTDNMPQNKRTPSPPGLTPFDARMEYEMTHHMEI